MPLPLNKTGREAGRLMILLLSYALVAMWSSPWLSGLGYDKEVFQYMGMAMAQGDIPYLDAFDHKPPIIFLVNRLGYLLTPGSIWGVFAVLHLTGAAAALYFYRLSRQMLASPWLAMAITMVYIGMSNHPDLLLGGNLTRQLAAFFVVFISYLIFARPDSAQRGMRIGILCGLLFFTQQNELLAAGVLVGTWAIFADEAWKIRSIQEIMRRMGWLMAGVAIPVMLMGLLILWWGNEAEFFEQAFLFNLNSYLEESPFYVRLWQTLKQALSLSRTVWLLPSLVVAILFNLWRKKSIDIRIIAVCLALLVQVVSTSLSGRAFEHYYLMFIPYLCLLWMFSLDSASWRYEKAAPVLVGVLLLCQLALSYGPLRQKQVHDAEIMATLTEAISSERNRPGQFYSFDPTYLRVNVQLGIVSPSRWIYVHFTNTAYDPDGAIIREVADDLLRAKTRFVLIGQQRIPEYPEVAALLGRDYESKMVLDGMELFERKE